VPTGKRSDISALAAKHPPPLSGRRGLFTTPPQGPAGTEAPAALASSVQATAEAALIDPESEPAAPRSRAARAGGLRPIRRDTDKQIRSEPDVQVERSYVLGAEHDRMLHELAVVRGLTVKAVVQEALAQLLDRYEGHDLRRLEDVPFTAGPGPSTAVRRTVAIRSEHDRILRSLRLLFGLRASDMVRQAITGYYRACDA
jgi:hypothetical protein